MQWNFFLIAHEYAHLILDHNPIGKENVALRLKMVGNSKFEFTKRDWEQEVSADLFALALLNEYLQTQEDDLGLSQLLFTMPKLFFALSNIAEKSKFIYSRNSRVPDVSFEQNVDYGAQIDKIDFRNREEVKPEVNDWKIKTIYLQFSKSFWV